MTLMTAELGRDELNDAGREVMRFDLLPDDVLLDIFDFYMRMNAAFLLAWYNIMVVETWQTLVHVCRRWRSLVFRSPRRLNLRLVCNPETRMWNPAMLDVWPAFLLVVNSRISTFYTDNIIAALGHSNRVCEVFLPDLSNRAWERVSVAMQDPFPELACLELTSDGKTPLVIPDSFLGGLAPSLRRLVLERIAFPELPNLLLSATHLVELYLTSIPRSWHISPETIVALISTLSNLETLLLQFESLESRPDWETRRPHSPNRSILPALKCLKLGAVTEYIEDLVTLIDTPRLIFLEIKPLNELDFDIRRLAQFINRTPKLRSRERHEAHVISNARNALISLEALGTLRLVTEGGDLDRQLSSLAQVCDFSLHPLSMVEDLSIIHHDSQLYWTKDMIEDLNNGTLWLRILLPFTAVKNLRIYEELAPGIAAALQGVIGGRITEVLPSLQHITVDGLDPSGAFNTGQFVSARQLSGHPVTITFLE